MGYRAQEVCRTVHLVDTLHIKMIKNVKALNADFGGQAFLQLEIPLQAEVGVVVRSSAIGVAAYCPRAIREREAIAKNVESRKN